MSLNQQHNLFQTIQRLLRMGATSNAKNLITKLHPTDIASIIPLFPEEDQDRILSYLNDNKKIADIFSRLGSSFLNNYLKNHPDHARVAKILEMVASDDRADLLKELNDEDVQTLLSLMTQDNSSEVNALLQYQETTAGALMSTEIFKLTEDMTVQNAIKTLREAHKAETIYYIYVVDELNNLKGVISLRQLFRAQDESILKELMFNDVVRVTVDESQKEVARLVSEYDFVALPVVDTNNKLMGVITVDDVIDVIQEEAIEHAMKMGQASTSDLEGDGGLSGIRKKLTSYMIIFLGGLIICEVITDFYQWLPPEGIFAGFIPIILRLSGLIARQMSTISIYEMAQGLFFPKRVFRILIGQLCSTAIIGFFTSLTVVVYAFFRFHDDFKLSLAIVISLFCAMFLSVLVGFFIPYFLRKIRVDSTHATGPVVNFFLDILTLLLYFGTLIRIVK